MCRIYSFRIRSLVGTGSFVKSYFDIYDAKDHNACVFGDLVMTPSLLAAARCLFLVAIFPCFALEFSGDREDLDASGQDEQLDAYPDPAGGFCQRNKKPKGLGFIGVNYDLLKGNPEGKTSLGGVDPGLEITRKILKLTNDKGMLSQTRSVMKHGRVAHSRNFPRSLVEPNVIKTN